MKKRNLRTFSSMLVLGLLLTGCAGTDTDTASNDITITTEAASEETAAETAPAVDYSAGVSDDEATSEIVVDGIQSAVINSHNVTDISSSEYGDQYIALDTVNVTYNAGDQTGRLPQTVQKDFEFYFNKDTSEWDMLAETLSACEVDNTAFPGSSWHFENIDSDAVKQLFGDSIESAEDGELYIHFLKRVGVFSFNLTNENNTSNERFFTTVGTSGKLNWVNSEGVTEISFSVTNGSVSDDGVLTMDVSTDDNMLTMNFGTDVLPITEYEYDTAIGAEIDETKVYLDTLPRFDLTSESIDENGEWKTEIGLFENNNSPELTWDAVDGATKYALLMIDDTTSNNWFHWFALVDTTHVDLGAYTDSKVDYAGPYPPETHEYDVYVIALADEPESIYFELDTPGGDIYQRLNDLNTKSDGTTGNVLAYGLIEADYTPIEDYYGDR